MDGVELGLHLLPLPGCLLLPPAVLVPAADAAQPRPCRLLCESGPGQRCAGELSIASIALQVPLPAFVRKTCCPGSAGIRSVCV